MRRIVIRPRQVENAQSTPLVQIDLKRSHDASNEAQVEFTYDDLGRVTLADATGTSNDVAITYDVFGNIETLAKDGATISYDWDALGRLNSETTAIAGDILTVSYLYDAAGRRIRMTYPDGFYLTYEYWGSGGLSYIRENGSNIIAAYEYDAFGRGQQLIFGNGVTRQLGFDAANRVSDLDFTVPSDTAYSQEIDYGFNVASQITSKTLMTDLYLPTELAESANYGVNGLNQITSETLGGTVFSFDHDKNGNLTTDGIKNFTYDLFNRLTSVSGGASFEYDASGRLYSIITPTINTYFLYDGTALIGEYTVDGSGNVDLLRRYVHGLDVDTPIVWYEGNTVSDSTRRYLVRDELGSVVLVTDNNGEAIQHNTYDEYGVPNTDNLGRFQYTGQTWLYEAELYYYKARVYNPYLGRFLQTDPIGYGDGLNLYAYVGNDPMNLRDPNGLAGCTDVASQGLDQQSCYDSTNFRDEPEEGLFGTKEANDFRNNAVGTPHTDNAAAVYGQVKNQSSGPEQAARIDVSKYGAATTTDLISTSATSSSASFSPADLEGADAMVHTHPTDKTTAVPGGGSSRGDWQAPARLGIPNYLVHGSDTVIVVEISGGQIRARVVKGSLNRTDKRALRETLNAYQRAGKKY